MKDDELEALRLRFESHLPRYGALWKSMAKVKPQQKKKPVQKNDFLTAIENKTVVNINNNNSSCDDNSCPFDDCKCAPPIYEEDSPPPKLSTASDDTTTDSPPTSEATTTLQHRSPLAESSTSSSSSGGSTVIAFDISHIVCDEDQNDNTDVDIDMSQLRIEEAPAVKESSAEEESSSSSSSSGGSTVVAFDISHLVVENDAQEDSHVDIDMSQLRINDEKEETNDADEEDPHEGPSFEHLDAEDEESSDDDDDDDSDDSSGGTVVRFDISHLVEQDEGEEQEQETAFELLPPATPSLQRVAETTMNHTEGGSPIEQHAGYVTGDFNQTKPTSRCNSPTYEIGEDFGRGYETGDSQVGEKNEAPLSTPAKARGDNRVSLLVEERKGYETGDSLVGEEEHSFSTEYKSPTPAKEIKGDSWLVEDRKGYETGDSVVGEDQKGYETGDSVVGEDQPSFSKECKSPVLVKEIGGDSRERWLEDESDDEESRKQPKAPSQSIVIESDSENEWEEEKETQSSNAPSKVVVIESDSENEWEDENEFLIDTMNRKPSNTIVILSDDDSSVDSPPQKVQGRGRAVSFQKHRDAITHEAFREFNELVFKKKLSSVEVTWSSKLKTTAGLTRLSRRTIRGETVRTARIELNPKVLDESERLRNTLLHEMCHAAQFLVDGVSSPPHGRVFKKWANRAMDAITDATVTTTHDYEIQYKYAWACTTDKCGAIFQRQSRSIDIEKQRCGKCKGMLVEINAPRKGAAAVDRTPRKKAPMSRYNQFVKDNSAMVRARLESQGQPVTQAQVMKEIGAMWKEAKQSA